MGNDVFNNKKKFDFWKSELTPKYIEEGLTKQNSKLFINYILDMEQGINIPKKAVKGGRSPQTLNRLRIKIKTIFKGLQEMGVNDVSKVTYAEITKHFKLWEEQGHTTDYAKRFTAFWNWWMTKNRREGKVIQNICEDLRTTGKTETDFVWITKEEFDNFRKYFNKEKQLCLLFCYDAIVRAPSELFGLKVENIYVKNNDEVWVNIPDEISKTFGRHFNLVYCGNEILKFIEGKDPEEPLFKINYISFTKEIQRVAEQVFGNKKSQGGEFYKKITLYDLRHSGAINFRQLFQKTGQSLDSLRHRGGWKTFKMIDRYTKLLGLDGHINKEKFLLGEDRTRLEKELEEIKEKNKAIVEMQFKLIKEIEKMKDPNKYYDEEKKILYITKEENERRRKD